MFITNNDEIKAVIVNARRYEDIISIDLTILMPNTIYIIEFKGNLKDGKNALSQIKENNYSQKYLQEKKDIYLVGIEFDSKEKNISNFEWEKI